MFENAMSSMRQPKGDHNRRISLGLDINRFALIAGVLPEQLREYEHTVPTRRFDAWVAQRVGTALDLLESPPSSRAEKAVTSLASLSENEIMARIYWEVEHPHYIAGADGNPHAEHTVLSTSELGTSHETS